MAMAVGNLHNAHTGTVSNYTNSTPLSTEFERVYVQDGETPPQARRFVFVPTGRSLESLPPQHEYLKLPGTLVLEEGKTPPDVPGGYAYRPTGRVLESLPPQMEYKLAKAASAATPTSNIFEPLPADRPVTSVAAEPANPSLSAGDSVTITGWDPPQAPQGHRFILINMLETAPPTATYKLFQETLVVSNPYKVPETPPGFEYILEGILDSYPPQYMFSLQEAQ